MKQPVRVTVTGAAGQIGYALLFRIASGSMLGNDQRRSICNCSTSPLALNALNGVKMELDDCAFPLLAGVVCTDDPKGGVQRRGLCPAGRRPPPRPRHGAQATCWKPTRRYSPYRARRYRRSGEENIKVLVVGNPANTNALIAQRNAIGIDPKEPSPP